MSNRYFIIGDVHGCLITFQEMVSNWDPKSEVLIQLGDLIDRGSFSPQTIQYCMDLNDKYPENTIFLRGNHEQMMLDYFDDISTTWLTNGGRETMLQFNSSNFQPADVLPWLKKLPFYYETIHLYVSHAGISNAIDNPLNPRDPKGILWNRGPLKNIAKTQIIGHTPLNNGMPAYSIESNSWNIDTGAYRGICLSGMKFDENGKFLETISIPTKEQDFNLGIY